MRFSYYFKQGNWYFLALIYTILLLWILIFIDLKFHNLFITLVALIPAVFFYIFSINVFKKIKYLDKGLYGENLVRKELDKLHSGYYSLYDFKKGKNGNIDAIVVGPTGIWTIEVKNYNKIIIDTQYLESHLDQAYAESKGLSEYLSLPVIPVLVFTNPKTIIRFGHNKQKGVYVIGKSWLVDLIMNETTGISLSPEQCTQIEAELKKFTSII